MIVNYIMECGASLDSCFECHVITKLLCSKSYSVQRNLVHPVRYLYDKLKTNEWTQVGKIHLKIPRNESFSNYCTSDMTVCKAS